MYVQSCICTTSIAIVSWTFRSLLVKFVFSSRKKYAQHHQATFNEFMHSVFRCVWDTHFSSLECFLLVYVVTIQFAPEHISRCMRDEHRYISEHFSNTLLRLECFIHISYGLFAIHAAVP